jgi:hypothetical protein
MVGAKAAVPLPGMDPLILVDAEGPSLLVSLVKVTYLYFLYQSGIAP